MSDQQDRSGASKYFIFIILVSELRSVEMHSKPYKIKLFGIQTLQLP